MSNIQIDLLYFINNVLQNPFLDAIVPIIYFITDAWVILVLIILFIMVSWIFKKKKANKIAILMFIAVGMSLVLVLTSKKVYPSLRPYMVLEGIRLAVFDNGFYSFPSGHFSVSVIVVSIIVMKAEKYKRELFALSILYLLMMFFILMYAGVHYPIDVIVGGIIGIISAVITVRYLEGLVDYFLNLINFN